MLFLSLFAGIFFRMDQEKKSAGRVGKIVKLLIKLLVSGLCLWYVAGKIDWVVARDAVAAADSGWLALAAAFFVLSKIFSSVRLLIYFHDIKVPLDQRTNLRLYWLGMFYNLLLPGAISGDAYKVILLKQWYNTSMKKAGSAVLIDRVSGMVALLLLLGLYGWLVLPEPWQIAGVTTAALGSAGLLYLVVSRWMRDFRGSYFVTLVWGLLVQSMQVICIYLVMKALGIPLSESGYLFLFLLSSIAAVLPLTIGGLGIREIVFLHGSELLGLTESKAVVISLIFYLITVLVSLAGVWFVFNSPIKKPGKMPG
jgi:uncharacterized membrane protein YbhN (UPF0104 family)